MITEILHVSSRCGGGKSLNTLKELYPYLVKNSEETVIFASKTNDLTQQNHAGFLKIVAQRVDPVASVRVDSSTDKGAVIRELSELLTAGYSGVIFTSHSAIARIHSSLLKKVRLLVDEVPQELVESIQVRYEAKDQGAKWESFLTTHPSSHTGYQKTVLHPSVSQENVQRYIDNIREGRDTSTTQEVASLLEFLLADYEVMYTTVCDAKKRVYRLYQAIHWQKLDQIISNVAHFAILSAQLRGTLLGFVAEHHCGIPIQEVPVTSQINLEAKHSNKARIIPLLAGGNWSATLKEKPANEALSYQGVPVSSPEPVALYAQQVAEQILGAKGCLLVLNKDDPLHAGLDRGNVERITIAVHGSNNYRHFDHAVYLASSRPNPFEVKSLQMFAVDHNLPENGITQAVMTERCYEAAYQCIARTSIRNPQADPNKEHLFIVPDMEYAKYIQSWFEPGYAIIDAQYAHTKQPTARRDKEKENRRAVVIRILTDYQAKQGKRKDLIMQAGISESSFRRYKKEFRAELEGLGLIRPKRSSTKTGTKTAA
ncbi:hypothetical protein [Halomonas cerina]|uniref:Uncharacterized protein n=1 Tax=Halomonas cerina TaxID=447424 RepID=A0A839V5H3_9GAMM|nr:hypothetical protein [Halomonas cerina]MBB3190933.1 hypothetical protein [Halomonas cerina]